ncbi:hypothetical protein D3C78_1445050 [compost metagenome]
MLSETETPEVHEVLHIGQIRSPDLCLGDDLETTAVHLGPGDCCPKFWPQIVPLRRQLLSGFNFEHCGLEPRLSCLGISGV